MFAEALSVVVVGTAPRFRWFRASAGLTAPAYQSQFPHLESGVEMGGRDRCDRQSGQERRVTKRGPSSLTAIWMDISRS